MDTVRHPDQKMTRHETQKSHADQAYEQISLIAVGGMEID